MERERIIEHLTILGQVFAQVSEKRPWPGFKIGISEDEYKDVLSLIAEAEKLNAWFTESEVLKALSAWSHELREEKLKSWLEPYPYVTGSKKNVGVIMAGNIPLVGFHDLISVLLSGHRIIIRPSSDDHILIRMVGAVLSSLDDRYKDHILWADGRMKGHEAVIATGSNNTSRYFEHYFSNVPHIIRKNRHGIAILDGTESDQELKDLGNDIFQYFGLGCRNVSKMYVPDNFDLDRFFGGIYSYHEIIQHNKYANNFDYYRSIFLLNADPILENGFLLLKESKDLASPVASLNYERYSDLKSLNQELEVQSQDIQCVISHQDIPFGRSQYPSLSDYADGVDTMLFLTEL